MADGQATSNRVQITPPATKAQESASLAKVAAEYLKPHVAPDRVRQDGTRVLAAYRATRDLTLGEASRIEHAMLRAAVLAEQKLNEANRG